MAVLDAANALHAAGRSEEAVALVRRSAQQGDPEALYAVANWHLFGIHGPRNVPAAHHLLDRARAAGFVDAIRLKAMLVGNGTGVASDLTSSAKLLKSIENVDPYAAVQLAMAEKIEKRGRKHSPKIEILSREPVIKCIRSFLLPDECHYIMTLAEPHLQPSFVIHPQTGKRIPHPVRTSSGMSFGPTQEDYVIQLINRRIGQATGTEPFFGEPLHVLRYASGQEYRPHLDAIPGMVNQRHWTMLIYLNEEYDGGETHFDVLDVKFSGKTGDALIFRNVDDFGHPAPATRHAGCPVGTGVKWLATRWIRMARYDAWQQA